MIGKVLGNRYEIIEKIGEGGMSLVYRAKCHLLNRFVAVKILRPEFTSDEEFVEKFDKESQAVASLSHPNIVNVYDVGNDQDIRYIVMELVEGITLKELIKKQNKKLEYQNILKITKGIALAIEHAHMNGIIHRDIKPQNILIMENGLVKVTDFGIARAITSSTIINTSDMMGSVHYSSPEQTKGGYVDEKSDIYSLGIVMYEMATGELPFDGETPVSVALKHMKEEVVPPSKLNDELNLGYESVILKAINKDLGVRYQTIRELIDDVNKLVEYPDENVAFYEFDNDQKTRVLPKIEEPEEMNSRSRRSKSSEKNESGGNHKSKVALMVLGALALSVLIISIVSFNLIKNRFAVKEVEVPNIVKMEIDEAVEVLNGKGLVLNISGEEYNNDFEQGMIISQDHDLGEVLEEGTTINVVVSKGHLKTYVPNLIHKDLDSAKLIIENNEFVVGEIIYETSDLPKNLVITQSPGEGEVLDIGGTVTITVSKGLEIKTYIMPNLVGKSESEAKKLLGNIKSYVGKKSQKESLESEKGKILSQSVRSGSEIKEKSYVNIVIGSGGLADPASETAENPGETAENTETGESDGDLGLISKAYNVPLNFSGDKAVVKVVKIVDGEETVVYNKEHSKDEQSVRVTVKSKGKTQINVYYDDELKLSTEDTFQ
ncbi:MAG: Stk1 family PASTA domain-containing Ser/Thr kinase [Firmicutes bacterium]|jgi:serine/threonine-protein kinase|nr:Stk1 family PASTA domain-containing Ser/Thr kinase [Bacillota bacterium]